MPGSGKEVATVQSPTGQIDGLVATANDRAVAWGVREGLVTLWEVPSGKRLTPAVGHSSAVNSVAFAPGGKIIVSSAADRELIEWNPATGGARTTTVKLPPGYPADYGSALQHGATILSPDGSYLVAMHDRPFSPPGPTLFQPNSMTPRKPASRKKAVRTS